MIKTQNREIYFHRALLHMKKRAGTGKMSIKNFLDVTNLSPISQMKMLKWSAVPFVPVDRLLQGLWPKELNLNDRINYFGLKT